MCPDVRVQNKSLLLRLYVRPARLDMPILDRQITCPNVCFDFADFRRYTPLTRLCLLQKPNASSSAFARNENSLFTVMITFTPWYKVLCCHPSASPPASLNSSFSHSRGCILLLYFYHDYLKSGTTPCSTTRCRCTTNLRHCTSNHVLDYWSFTYNGLALIVLDNMG